MKFICITLLVTICGAITGFSLSTPKTDKHPLLNSKQIEQWRADIDFMQRELEYRHINLYHQIDANFFELELLRIKQQLASLTEAGVAIELMRVIKQVGDGHTQFAYWGSKYHRYPLELRHFDKDLRVIGIARQHQSLLGAKLVAIEGTALEKLQQLIEPILQGVENIYSAQQRFVETITVAEILYGLKISQSLQQTRFTFKLPTGEELDISLDSLPSQALHQNTMASLKRTTLTNFVPQNISIDGMDVQLSSNNQIMYLDFHHYPRISAMEDFVENLSNLLRKKNTKAVIIDLRNNGGGDFFVGLQLARALIMVDNLNWREGIYVLIGRKTFSAAMSNAAQYRQLLNATLVGEPTGANPVGYQDAGTFQLPHSGWTLMYSKRMYRFQETPTAGIQPDIRITLDWKLLQQGRDNQLEWILEDLRNRWQH